MFHQVVLLIWHCLGYHAPCHPSLVWHIASDHCTTAFLDDAQGHHHRHSTLFSLLTPVSFSLLLESPFWFAHPDHLLAWFDTKEIETNESMTADLAWPKPDDWAELSSLQYLSSDHQVVSLFDLFSTSAYDPHSVVLEAVDVTRDGLILMVHGYRHFIASTLESTTADHFQFWLKQSH